MFVPSYISTYSGTGLELFNFVKNQQQSNSAKLRGILFVFVFLANFYLLKLISVVKLLTIRFEWINASKKRVVVLAMVTLAFSLAIPVLFCKL